MIHGTSNRLMIIGFLKKENLDSEFILISIGIFIGIECFFKVVWLVIGQL